MLHLCCVNMPRSGHHYLHRVLHRALEGNFGYCEFYKEWKFNAFAPCCKNIPCTKAKGSDFAVFMQKNHDFGQSHPIRDDLNHVAQIRHPLPRLISHFRLRLRKRPDEANDAGFRAFAEQQSRYYVKFWNRWIAPDRPNVYVLRHEEMTEQPGDRITGIFDWFGYDNVDRDALREAVAAEQDFRDMTKRPFEPKPIAEFEFYDRDFMEAYLARIAEQCPGFAYALPA